MGWSPLHSVAPSSMMFMCPSHFCMLPLYVTPFLSVIVTLVFSCFTRTFRGFLLGSKLLTLVSPCGYESWFFYIKVL